MKNCFNCLFSIVCHVKKGMQDTLSSPALDWDKEPVSRTDLEQLHAIVANRCRIYEPKTHNENTKKPSDN